MAGHRRGTGKQRRSDSRIAAHEARLENAPTGWHQLAAAYDRHRSAVRRAARVRAIDPALELNEVATLLNERAKQVERTVAA